MAHLLHEWVREGDLKNVKMLLDRGVDVNFVDYFEQTRALSVAAELENHAMVRLLLEYGAELSVHENNVREHTALHSAAYSHATVCVACLIEHDVDVNVLNDIGDSALALGARFSPIELVKALVENGADLEVENKYELNALAIAASASRPEVVSLLAGRTTLLERALDRVRDKRSLAALEKHVARRVFNTLSTTAALRCKGERWSSGLLCVNTRRLCTVVMWSLVMPLCFALRVCSF